VIPDDGAGQDATATSTTVITPPQLTIESSDILRLIQHHLTECGLHGAARALREESGVGAAGVHRSGLLRAWAREGRWADVLECLEGLDAERCGLQPSLVADVHEMSILELTDSAEFDLAFAALRLCSDELDELSAKSVVEGGLEIQERRTASIERRINALASLRSLQHGTSAAVPTTKKGGSASLIPPDYYGPNNISRQKRREEIGKALSEAIAVVPSSRLTSLLQQAVKWQAHTGQLPQVRELWDDEESNDDAEDEDKAKKKKRKRSKKRRKKFDLVLGEVDILAALEEAGGIEGVAAGDSSKNAPGAEKIVRDPYSTIKFGKKSFAECAQFLPDGSGLVTGSCDGFIEIWDPESRYTNLRLDLPYQKADEILMHDAAVLALAVSNDGTMLGTGSSDGMVKVWKVDDGKCLRQFENAHRGAISCLAFSADASHVLSGSHDSTCREFGLRASRMLKEFRGHNSYINSCSYVTVEGSSPSLLVVSGSADGTVRVWDGRSAECMHVINPTTASQVTVGASLAMTSAADESVAGKSVQCVIPVHTPPNSMVIVPRAPHAYLVSHTGSVLRVFNRDDTRGRGSGIDEKADFIAATVSPSNKWLYVATEDGLLLCFDVATGKIEKTIRDFGVETSGKENAEISGLVHHVHKSLLGGYSNDKGLKRGRLVLWK